MIVNMDSFIKQFKCSIVDEIGIGRDGWIKPTVYDTTWLARVPSEHDGSKPAFPKALDWLRQSQRSDGSWGAEIEYVHDRVVSTLSALLALAVWDQGGDTNEAAKRGLDYIGRNVDRLENEYETIGFEVIIPTFLRECNKRGFELDWSAFERYENMQEAKLAKIPSHIMYSRQNPLAFSMEFMGDDLDAEMCYHLQEDNGSVGMSPSATAYLLTRWPDNVSARRYVNRVAEAYSGKLPQVFPFDAFETAWCLWNLFLDTSGPDGCDQQISRHACELGTAWNDKQGIGFSSRYSVIDADGTAVAFSVLKQAGLDPDINYLRQFEQNECFACYLLERNPSISANIHALEAIQDGYEAGTTKIVRWLRRKRQDGGYWIDKWHVSPYYPTAHAVIALVGVDNDLARDAVQWILSTQQSDGGWGYYGRSTAEETAYCLQALSIYAQRVEPIDRAVLLRGRDSLLGNMNDLPELWIGKCLYVPIKVVQSAICSALIMTGSFR